MMGGMVVGMMGGMDVMMRKIESLNTRERNFFHISRTLLIR
jgi:hypothetical protein